MATIVYGTHNFKKNLGPHGEAYECPCCHNVFQDVYVKINKWGHLEYIPLIPLGSYYIHFCPICANGDKFEKNKIAKENIKAETAPSTQNIEYRSVFHKSAKPKTYDLYAEDKNTGKTYTIREGLPKADYKYELKIRCIKKLQPTVD